MLSHISSETPLTTKIVKRTYTGIVTRASLLLQYRTTQVSSSVPKKTANQPKVTCRTLVPYKAFVPFVLPTIVLLVPMPSIDIMSLPLITKPTSPSNAGACIVYTRFVLPRPVVTTKLSDNRLALIPFVCSNKDQAESIQAEEENGASLISLVLLFLVLLTTLIGSAIDHFGHAIECHRHCDTFEEAARLNSLFASMKYSGESFVSKVCPPLTTNGFNIVALYKPLVILRPKKGPTLVDMVLEEVIVDLKIVFKQFLPLLRNLFTA